MEQSECATYVWRGDLLGAHWLDKRVQVVRMCANGRFITVACHMECGDLRIHDIHTLHLACNSGRFNRIGTVVSGQAGLTATCIPNIGAKSAHC